MGSTHNRVIITITKFNSFLLELLNLVTEILKYV